jgi:transforming growth factor-beta-induced protein
MKLSRIAPLSILGLSLALGACSDENDPVLPNLMDTARAAENFTTLVAALEAAGLDETLENDGPFTVFAPTDEAFAQLPDGTIEALLDDIDALTAVLLYHVTSGNLPATGVVASDQITMLQGTAVDVSVSNDGVFVNSALVLATDQFASNGIIHVINEVLLPPQPAQ